MFFSSGVGLVTTTARAIYGENTCNFGANQTVTKNAFGAALHTTPFDRVNGDI
jgi:hypothetical protein